MLPEFQRDDFVRSIANRLRDLPYPPSDADVHAAVSLVLSSRGRRAHERARIEEAIGDHHGPSIRRRRSV